MTKIKLCGLSSTQDIKAANRLTPDYIGFVFAEKSKRYISPKKASALKQQLDPSIKAVGVFVNEKIDTVAGLLLNSVIDIAQLHGGEDDGYIARLREMTGKPVIKAFIIRNAGDVEAAERSSADYILLDSGKGSGKPFDQSLLKAIKRPYFLAGGLSPENVAGAVQKLRPFAVDVSSGIETGGVKDIEKMTAFVGAVRMVDET